MNTTTPTWMLEKVKRLAIERAKREGGSPEDALVKWTGEAFQILQGELKAFPKLANLLPSLLVRNIKTGAFDALSALDMAAMVIVDNDAQEVSVCIDPDDLAEFTLQKWESIAYLLQTKMESENVRQRAA